MRLRPFFVAFILGLLFWGVNIFQKNLEDFLFWREMAENPQILAAKANQEALEEKLRNLKPLRNWQVEELKIEAKSAISVLLDNEGGKRVLFQKNSAKILPIASLTKLMTANIVLENYDLSQEIQISKKAVTQEEEFGKLKVGRIFPVKYLLYPLLMESSNDAAFSLANDYKGMEEEKFIELMNSKARDLELENTNFVNPTGLDSGKENEQINYSTVEDLVKFTQYLLQKPLIWEILSTPKFDLYGPELINTNKLLEPPTNVWWGAGIIGGKTGYTEKSRGCFLLVLKAPKDQGFLISIILESENRFGEMKKLIDWLKLSYSW